MKVLLHICCANCAVYPLERLRDQGHEVLGLFFNPNIQPYEEFRRRRESVEDLARIRDLKVIMMDDYPLDEFFRRMVFREGQRCLICYQWRLETTARVARRGKYDAFTTTLLFSKQQKHDRIRQSGEEEARKAGVRFLYEDYRTGWESGREMSKALGFYRQNYCGCIYSERDRYAPESAKARGRSQAAGKDD